MSSQPQRPSSSQTLLGSLVVASLLACACSATPDQTGDGSGAGGYEVGTGGSAVAGAGSFTNGTAGSVSAGGAIGTAGAFGTSGSTGTAGSFGAAGAFGTAGSVGVAGSGGSGGSGSAGGFGGQGFGGQPHGGFGGQGFGGQSHGGSGSMGGSGGSGGAGTVTFTQLYTKYFNSSSYASNCTGGSCHNPGTQRGIDFSTQAKGYTSVKNSLSQVISTLSSGSMPRGRPQWSTADLALLKAWQAEGAPNN